MGDDQQQISGAQPVQQPAPQTVEQTTQEEAANKQVPASPAPIQETASEQQPPVQSNSGETPAFLSLPLWALALGFLLFAALAYSVTFYFTFAMVITLVLLILNLLARRKQ